MVGRCALVLACATLAFPLLAACTSSVAAQPGLQIVASTNVYGELARAVAGRAADVRALIADPDQDPHTYEADARDQLAIAKADVIIENGGGYDDFVDRMAAASGARNATLINVVALSGKHAEEGELNEHVWYDVPTVVAFVARLQTVLSKHDPGDRTTFARNAATLTAKLHALERAEAEIRARATGTDVAITEPVPLYLLEACGLVNKTPARFSEAVEEDTGVSAGVLNQTLELFTEHQVHALVYNEQTSGAETTRVIAAAKANGIPTVPVTETLPAGNTYVSWMRANLQAVAMAVAS